MSTFVAVYEGHYKNQSALVKKTHLDDLLNGDVAIKIETSDGGEDVVLSSFTGKEISGFDHSSDAGVAVYSKNGKMIIGGSSFDSNFKGVRNWTGEITQNDFKHKKNASYIDLT